MGLLARKTRDDRGVVRELYGTGYGISARMETALVPDDVLVRVRRGIRAGRRARFEQITHSRIVAIALWVTMLLAFNVIFLLGSLGRFWLVSGAVIVTALGVLWALSRRGLRAGSPEVVREAMLAEKRCPSCAYSLAGMVAAEDSCVVCPECGGAWRLPKRPCSWCGHELAGARTMADGFIYCATCSKPHRPEA
jgi:hypothetical protein